VQGWILNENPCQESGSGIKMNTQSKKSKIKDVVQSIEDRIKAYFNRDVFSIYEGIVEGKDNVGGTLKVRIPELNNILQEECRVMAFCSGGDCNVTSNFAIGTHVIIGFRAFSLKYPVVLGQISPENQTNNQFIDDTINFSSGKSSISFHKNSIVMQNGTSSVIISESGIRLNGTYITANGEDLTVDKVTTISLIPGIK
jgi:hypothetical protein